VDKFGGDGGKQTLILIPGLGSGPWVVGSTRSAKFSPANTIYVLTLPGFDGRPATDDKQAIRRVSHAMSGR
jgi:hypothetical protein